MSDIYLHKIQCLEEIISKLIDMIPRHQSTCDSIRAHPDDEMKFCNCSIRKDKRDLKKKVKELVEIGIDFKG